MDDLKHFVLNNDRSYPEGVKLYEKYVGRDKFLKFFQQVANADAKSAHYKLLLQRLQNRLRIISQNQEVEPAITAASAPQTPINIRRIVLPSTTPVSEIKLNEEKLPDDIKALYNENKRLHIDIAGAHAAMKSAKTDADRQFHLSKAITWQEQKDTNWKIIDDFLKTQKGDIIQVQDNDLLEKRIQTLNKYIRRTTDDLKEKKHTPEKAEEKREKIKVWKQELKELKARKRGQRT